MHENRLVDRYRKYVLGKKHLPQLNIFLYNISIHFLFEFKCPQVIFPLSLHQKLIYIFVQVRLLVIHSLCVFVRENSSLRFPMHQKIFSYIYENFRFSLEMEIFYFSFAEKTFTLFIIIFRESRICLILKIYS